MLSAPHYFIRPRRTRHLVFTRVNPKTSDYDTLLRVATMIDATVFYKTMQDPVTTTHRLIGTLILSGPPAYPEQIGRMLPNFLVSKLHRQFPEGVYWMDWIGLDGRMHSNRARPLESVKVKLFRE